MVDTHPATKSAEGDGASFNGEAFRATNTSTPTLAPRESDDHVEKKSEDRPSTLQEKVTVHTPIISASPSANASQLDVSKEPNLDEKQDAENPAPEGLPVEIDEAEENFKPKSIKFWLTIFSNFIALFLVALDRTIIATAIPRITDEFGSLGDIGWYGSAYMLTTAASQLVFGRVYKFYNLRWVFLSSIFVFEIGSLLCGVAPNSATLIAGRAIAGVGSAGIFTGAMMVMIPMVPLHKRPMFQGIFGMVFGLASVIGPLIGGGFTGTVTWRWCFYMNLPIGGAALVYLFFMLKAPKQQPREPATLTQHILRLDPLGTFFFLPSIVALLLALEWGGATYAWSDGRIIALFIVFGVAFSAFAAVQVFMPKTATVPVRIITQRTMLAGAFFMFFLAGSMMLAVYYLPLWCFGLGFGMQTVGLAVQAVFPKEDVSTGVSISFFAQQLGAAIFVSVGQSILSNMLVSQLSGIPGLPAQVIVKIGATDLHKVVPSQFLDVVVKAYNYACTRIFLAGMGLSLATLVCALCMEWRNIKKGRNRASRIEPETEA
ncbi:Efflux pump aflT [Colletotrichum sp. SAR11_57]|nr:Efflux pump aflT [Colletotrichum sp. SAR11_57]